MTDRPAITRKAIRQLLADAYRRAKRATRSKWKQYARPMGWRELRDLADVDYPAYLRTSHWAAKRRAAVLAAKWTCRECHAHGWDVELHVHHLTYKRLGRERARDLRVLCAECHAREHGK